MSMSLVPDDCLLHIFNSIDDVHTLFKCLRVCRRWNQLVSYRLARVERLLDEPFFREAKIDEKTLYYDVRSKPLEKQILSKILQKTSKVKVVSVGAEYYRCEDYGWIQESIDYLSKLESLEGLMLTGRGREVDSIPKSIRFLYSDDTIIQNGYYPQVKHLTVEDDVFSESIHRFPNVEWLSLREIITYNPHGWFEVARINQHLFKNLKMLEMDITFVLQDTAGDNLAVQFIDFCPQLESAHLKIPADLEVHNDNFRHQNLTNLVITYVDFEELRLYLSNLLHLLRRFPNVKHLAIRRDVHRSAANEIFTDDSDDSGSDDMDDDEQQPINLKNDDSGLDGDDEAEERQQKERQIINDKLKTDELKFNKCLPGLIVLILKKLELLDMRGISGIEKSVADFVQYQFKKNKQLSGKFYYGNIKDDEIERDWPELFDKHQDKSAFHFMANHFLGKYPKPRIISLYA